MNPEHVLNRLRIFLLAFSAFLFAGALVELAFTGHTDEPVQLIPFFLCALGLLAAGAALARANRGSLLSLRASMALIALGSLFGVYEHFSNNIAFQVEIYPELTFLERLAAGLGGANPLLAPGVLGIAAALALAASYQHPALQKSNPAVERLEQTTESGEMIR